MALVEFTVMLKNPWFYSWHTRGSKNSTDFFLSKNDEKIFCSQMDTKFLWMRKIQLFDTPEPGLLIIIVISDWFMG